MKFLVLSAILVLPVAAQSPVPQRAGNLNVFRCVLDERPRVLVIRLGQEHAVAFDTEHGLLWKVWQAKLGELPVKLDGSVYNGKHGPQPTTQGNVFFTDDQPQLICSDASARLQYLGHMPQADGTAIARWAFRDSTHQNIGVIAVKPSFADGKIVLHYKLDGQTADGVKFTVRAPGSTDQPRALGQQALEIVLNS